MIATGQIFQISKFSDTGGTRMGKIPKGKEKTRSKMERPEKCAENQDNESIDSFHNYDSRRLLMFLYQGRLLP